MYLCYIDESGTPDIPGNTSHYVLAGLSIPIWHWKTVDNAIAEIKKKYSLEEEEIHTAWILRKYLEQDRISDFASHSYKKRRSEVEKYRKSELLRLQRGHNTKQYRQTKKNYSKTKAYIHLTLDERKSFIREVAQYIGDLGSTRLFAECIDKIHFDPSKSKKNVDEQAFEQVVSRFQHYLSRTDIRSNEKRYGLLIHDNNETVAKQHTQLMKRFLKKGTLWTKIDNIIETPLFVDSQLTSMVQVADLCAYALRRYLEKNEEELLELIISRGDRSNDLLVGIRHFTSDCCCCRICSTHRN